MAPQKKSKQVYLVVAKQTGKNVQIINAHSTREGADSYCEETDRDDLSIVELDVEDAPKSSNPASKRTHEDGQDDAKHKLATSKKQKPDDVRKHIAEGKSGSLEGLKLMFTGTFDMDRKTCEATAVTYGAQVVKTVNQADCVVFGAKPGQAKVDEVEKRGKKSINEAKFKEWLTNGPD